MYLPRHPFCVRQASVLPTTSPMEMASVVLSSHICRPGAGVGLSFPFAQQHHSTPQKLTHVNKARLGTCCRAGVPRGLCSRLWFRNLAICTDILAHQEAHPSSPEPSDIDPATDAQGTTLTRLYPMPHSPQTSDFLV